MMDHIAADTRPDEPPDGPDSEGRGRRGAPALFADLPAGPPDDGPVVLAFHGRYDFAATPQRVWDEIASVERLEQLWRWLRIVDATHTTVTSGTTVHGRVSPPIPWTMAVTVEMDTVVPGERVDATVTGDLVGPASLRIQPDEHGATVAVAWRMAMMQPGMRMAARLSRPLLVWGHDRVVESTVRGLRGHLSN